MSDHDRRGLTPRELARLLRVSPDRVRGWIARGELGAVNTAPTRTGKPRFVILPHHLTEWEQARQVSKPAPTQKRPRRTSQTDFYPD